MASKVDTIYIITRAIYLQHWLRIQLHARDDGNRRYTGGGLWGPERTSSSRTRAASAETRRAPRHRQKLYDSDMFTAKVRVM